MTESHADPLIRLATLDDAPAMVRVLESAFDRWPPFEIEGSAVDHLRWKMSLRGVGSVGHSNAAAHTVVEVDSEIVAVSVRWVTPFRLGDERLVQDSGIDQAVLPAMQGRGLGGKMARFAHALAVEYSDMSLGTGSSDERIPSIFDAFDPPAVQQTLPMRSRPFSARAFVATHRAGGSAARFARQALRAGRRLANRSGEVSRASLEELTAFDERVDPLWEAFTSRFDFAIDRSVDYLNWRYCEPAGGPAVVLGGYEDDLMVGYVVFKRSDDWSHVLDLVVQPDHPQAATIARELLDAGCRRMAEAGVRGSHVALTLGHPLGRMVEAAGFLPLGWSTHLTCGPQRRGRDSPLLDRFYAGETRNHLMLGDVDIY